VLGVAARAAAPYLQKPLTENAVLDLKPIASTARRNIEAAVAEFHKSADGVRADTEVKDLQLSGIEFDSRTLRIIAEAAGTVRLTVTKIPPPPPR
jgi:hypothetical protein